MRRAVTIFVPTKVVSEANQREHHMARYARKKEQQKSVSAIWLESPGCRQGFRLPVIVLFNRVGGRELDDDNRGGAFKHIRDAITRLILGDTRADDSDPRLAFVPGQRRRRRKEPAGVEVTIAEATDEELRAVRLPNLPLDLAWAHGRMDRDDP